MLQKERLLQKIFVFVDAQRMIMKMQGFRECKVRGWREWLNTTKGAGGRHYDICTGDIMGGIMMLGI
jgi:ferritin-like protein